MSYKLTYFNIRGKTECLRYIFALADQEYEDRRIALEFGNPEFSEEWQILKPSTLWGSIPELEYDGHRICQTPAIARFLGSQFGLSGKTIIETAQIDMIICCLEDIFSTIGHLNRIPKEIRPDAVEEKKTKFQEWITHLNEILISNQEGEGWFVGDSVTIADAYAYSLRPFIAHMYPDLLNKFPMLQAIFKRFEELPKIAKWIASRPETLF